MEFVKADYISMKKTQDMNEAWVQKIIAEEPSILGLGDLVLKDKERRQPKAGRLDLLLHDPDTMRRFEVEVQLGATDENEGVVATDRGYWELKGSKVTVGWADILLDYVIELDEYLELNYNKHYIGLNRNGAAINFISLRPKKKRLNLEIKIPKSVEVDNLIEETGFDTLEYSSRSQLYRLSLSKDDIVNYKSQLMELFTLAYECRTR